MRFFSIFLLIFPIKTRTEIYLVQFHKSYQKCILMLPLMNDFLKNVALTFFVLFLAFIEKNTWVGVEETFGQLKQLLQLAHPSRDAEERSERRAELPHPPAGGTMIIGPVKTRHPRPTRRRRGCLFQLHQFLNF